MLIPFSLGFLQRRGWAGVNGWDKGMVEDGQHAWTSGREMIRVMTRVITRARMREEWGMQTRGTARGMERESDDERVAGQKIKRLQMVGGVCVYEGMGMGCHSAHSHNWFNSD